MCSKDDIKIAKITLLEDAKNIIRSGEQPYICFALAQSIQLYRFRDRTFPPPVTIIACGQLLEYIFNSLDIYNCRILENYVEWIYQDVHLSNSISAMREIRIRWIDAMIRALENDTKVQPDWFQVDMKLVTF